MNSDRPYSNPEQVPLALECRSTPDAQVERPVDSCICPRKFYEGIVPHDPPGLGDIHYVAIGCPVHWEPPVYLNLAAADRARREREAWGTTPSQVTSTCSESSER